jgi:ankyrin repeat protein
MYSRYVTITVFAAFLACVGGHAVAGDTAVFEAIRKNDIAGLRALVETDRAKAQQRSEQGISPLIFAAYNERPQMVDYLKGKLTSLDFHEACVVGDIPTVKRFLARGVDVELRSPDGFTPLGLSVFFHQPAVAKLLVEAGADVNAKASNTLQVAPIHAAVARSDFSTLQLLLEAGADPDLTQQRLLRPIHEASAAGSLPAVAMLLMFGADPAARNEEGKTAGDFAREAGHLRIASHLDAVAARKGGPGAVP